MMKCLWIGIVKHDKQEDTRIIDKCILENNEYTETNKNYFRKYILNSSTWDIRFHVGTISYYSGREYDI